MKMDPKMWDEEEIEDPLDDIYEKILSSIRKRRAFEIISERFEDCGFIYDDENCFVIAHKESFNITERNENNIFMPYEKNAQKALCILTLIAFNDVEIDPRMDEWLQLGVGHDYITEEGFYRKNVS